MDKKVWESFKQYLHERTGIPSKVFDYMAVRDILHLIASGSGVDTVANFFDIEVETVQEVCSEFLNFSGYPEDLDINPYMIFNQVNYYGRSINDFIHEVSTLTPYYTVEEIKSFYTICLRFKDIENTLERYWV